MTAKFEDANKNELDFSLIKLREQLQSHFMKSVQCEKIKILVTEMLTRARVCVLNEKISLNQYVMIKKNLNNDVVIRNFLNQCEILEEISDLCNVAVDTPSDLHMRQETDLSSQISQFLQRTSIWTCQERWRRKV